MRPSVQDPVSSSPSPRSVILVLYSSQEQGIRSVGRTLAGILETEPHGLEVIFVDLTEAAAGRSLLQSLAARISARLETAAAVSLGWSGVAEALQGRTPETVVVLDPPAAMVADAWRARGLLRAPLVGVLAGLRLDPAWARTAVDRLSVADTEQAAVGLELGLPAECLVPSGIPVCGGFSSVSPDDQESIRRRFGLSTDKPLVLVVTEGLEPDEITGALFQLSLVNERAGLLFDVARNDESADLLRRRAALYDIQARMFGKVEEAGLLWAAADLVVARPFPFVEQRALALRLPLVALPRGSAEEETARIYGERGIGRSVVHLSTLAADIDLLLVPDRLRAARQTMGTVSRRTAAVEVARLIAQVRAQAAAILAEAARRVASAGATDTAASTEAPPPRVGPLETIGGEAGESGGTGAAAPAAIEEDLAAAEAAAHRTVSEHQGHLEHWERRVALARSKGDEELTALAGERAEQHREAMHQALAELSRLSDRRRAAGGPLAGDGRLERKFREMEVEEALAALKRQL